MGLLIAFGPNLRYLSEGASTGSNGNLLVRCRVSRSLFTDPRYQMQARQEVTCKVRIAKGPLIGAVARAIAKLGVKRIGFEPALMTCDFHESLKKQLPMKVSLEPVTGWIEGLRMVKSPDEIARIHAGPWKPIRAHSNRPRRV